MNKPQPKITGTETVGEILDSLKPQLTKLRAEFPKHQISKLPKETKAQREERERDKSKIIWNCPDCGGYHHQKAIHLDYVGHAALTDRLLDTDLEWTWEPVGFTPEGLPALDRNGGLWIKLTVCGVSRYGYGAADGKSGGDAMKEMIGDALRNAAMRFGAALELWHKGDLHVEEETDGSDASSPRGEGDMSDTALRGCIKTLVHNINGCATLRDLDELLELDDCKDVIEQTKRRFPNWWETGAGLPREFTPLKKLIEQTRSGLRQLETQE
jgi:hypothetical protein